MRSLLNMRTNPVNMSKSPETDRNLIALNPPVRAPLIVNILDQTSASEIWLKTGSNREEFRV